MRNAIQRSKRIVLVITLAACCPVLHAARANAQPPDAVQSESVSGRLFVIWGDPPRDSMLPPERRILISVAPGHALELLIDDEVLREVGGLHAVNGRLVTVTGDTADLPDGQLLVESITKQGERSAQSSRGLTGPQPWVTILCRFADMPSVTPHPVGWFDTLMDNNYPGMDHFWREQSYNIINLDGSLVVGWYDLPMPRSYYVYDIDDDGDEDLDSGRLRADATAVADPDVYFPDFMGINLMLNWALDGPSWGGSTGTIVLDGTERSWAITFMPPWGYERHATLGQEMGHGFGLPHSSGPYGDPYDSQWDVMSWNGSCRSPDNDYGCIGVHTVAHHKWLLGWIDTFDAPLFTPSAAMIHLRTLSLPAPGEFQAARLITHTWKGIPLEWYTIESRRLVGYDAEIPAEAVVIHDVDLGASGRRPAQVVDEDGNGDPNDAGAQWVSGESFVDPDNDIVISVHARTSTGHWISLTNSARDPTYVDSTSFYMQDGSSGHPWDHIVEGVAGVLPHGLLLADPGSYPESLIIGKPMIIQRWGASGSVVIGE